MEEKLGFLEQYGENLTKKVYITNPAIGREEEIRRTSLILLTPEKSVILTGEPGVGKTAIVEGLAYIIQKNAVPEPLLGYEIYKIDVQALMGTIKDTGDSRVYTLVEEIKARTKIILFLDEIHTLISSTAENTLDFANMFKTGLGRGDIKVIGATTNAEYERYVLRDKAFTRRFQKVDIPEPDRNLTIRILMGTIPKYERQTGVKMTYTPFIQEKICSFIVDCNKRYNLVFETAGRYPDTALNMLSQAFSEALFDGKDEVTVEFVERAIRNSKALYPDVVNKEIDRFRLEFKDMITNSTEEDYL